MLLEISWFFKACCSGFCDFGTPVSVRKAHEEKGFPFRPVDTWGLSHTPNLNPFGFSDFLSAKLTNFIQSYSHSISFVPG